MLWFCNSRAVGVFPDVVIAEARRRRRPEIAVLGAPRAIWVRSYKRRSIGLRQNRIGDLIAGQGLPFETLRIQSRLTAVVVVRGPLAIGHGVVECDPSSPEHFQEGRCGVTEH